MRRGPLELGTRRLYFEFQPVAEHKPDCPRRGTALVEATKQVEFDLDGEVEQETYRFACGECGEALFVFSDQDLDSERTNADQIGFGAKPERVGDLWLHPGPRLLADDEKGPWEYLVTREGTRPETTDAVVGKIRSVPGPRGGPCWSAAVGYDENGFVTANAEELFRSKRTAVGWISKALDSGYPGSSLGCGR